MDKKLLFCMVIEDEPLAQQVLENYIRRVKELKLVAKCESIEEAIATLNSSHIDVVFLDLNLKTEYGTEILKTLKASNKLYYTIITSAISQEQLINSIVFQDIDIRLTDHLTKPFSFERFLDAIHKILI
jgi:two-component system LytT family response regulator